MMRLNRHFAAATACKNTHTHTCALHARAVFRSAHGTRNRAVCEPPPRRNVDSTATLRGDA
eukprot:2600148-Lingulodinium_polyedra.AAC.1